MTFTPSPSTCGLHGPAGCYRRFAKSPKPVYAYDKRKAKRDGATVTIPWCSGVYPQPQQVTDAKCRHCPDWRDNAGNSAEQVRKAIAEGRYKSGAA